MEVWEKFGTAMEWILRAVVAYLVIRAIEYGARYLNRPKLQIFISEENPKQRTFIHRINSLPTTTGNRRWSSPSGPPQEFRQPFWIGQIKVTNSPPLKWGFEPRIVEQCYAVVHFMDETGNGFVTDPMIMRWDRRTEPVAPSPQGPLYDPERAERLKYIDIHPEETVIGDIAFRVAGDPQSYGWCDDNYQPNGAFDERWRLPPGRHRVRVTITSRSVMNLQWTRDFFLENEGKIDKPDELRLLPAS